MSSGTRTLAVGLAMATLAACGSTVAGQSTLSGGPLGAPSDGFSLPADGSAGDGLSLPGEAGSAGSGQSSDTVGSTGTTGGVGSTGTGISTTGSATAPTGAAGTGGVPAAPVSGGADGRGVTATTVKVGVAYISDAEAFNRALGAEVGEADAEAVFDAIVADINASGGIGGRKLVPVYAPYEANSAEPYDTIHQRVCTRMTQDDKVFAAIAAIVSETFRGCLQKAGVVHLYDGISRSDADVLRRYPFTFEVGSVRTDRVAQAQLAAMKDGGYFTPWDTTRGAPGTAPVKVGVVSSDAPSIARAVDQVLVPGLKRMGHDPVVVKIAAPQSTSQSGDTVAAIQGAALKMRAEGVTHVVPFESNGSLTLFFTRNAESQSYRPRYGVNTGNGLQVLLDAGSVPAEQAAGAVGLGTSPMLDLRAADNPDDGPHANAARAKCLSVMAQAGIAVPTTNVKSGILALCATAYFLRDRAAQVLAADAGLTRDSLRSVIERSGSAFLHGDVGRTAFGPGLHDGGALGHVWSYTPSCSCLRYSGRARAL
jgi:hypothetical protein